MRRKIRIILIITLLVNVYTPAISNGISQSSSGYFLEYSPINFSYYSNSGAYFDNLGFHLDIIFHFPSLSEFGEISIKVELTNIHNSQKTTIFDQIYDFNPLTAEIFELGSNVSAIGKLPILMRDSEGPDYEICRFKENITIGQSFKMEGNNFNLLGGQVPFYSILVDENTFTIYHYSIKNDVLINWGSFDQNDIFFRDIVGIYNFTGAIQLSGTNVEIGLQNSPLDYSFLIIVGLIVISFFGMFFFIRKELIKKRTSYYRKEKSH